MCALQVLRAFFYCSLAENYGCIGLGFLVTSWHVVLCFHSFVLVVNLFVGKDAKMRSTMGDSSLLASVRAFLSSLYSLSVELKNREDYTVQFWWRLVWVGSQLLWPRMSINDGGWRFGKMQEGRSVLPRPLHPRSVPLDFPPRRWEKTLPRKPLGTGRVSVWQWSWQFRTDR